MKGYKKVSGADLPRVAQFLIAGDRDAVLVRSLYRADIAPYPLLDISRGPYVYASGVLMGFSKSGVPTSVRISDSDLQHVELCEGSGEWFAPEMGGVILLLRE
jgi:hypothetical protein